MEARASAGREVWGARQAEPEMRAVWLDQGVMIYTQVRHIAAREVEGFIWALHFGWKREAPVRWSRLGAFRSVWGQVPVGASSISHSTSSDS